MQAGFSAVALEFDDFGNASRWSDYEKAMLDSGILPGVWFTDPTFMVFCPPDAAFVVAEVETDGDYEGLIGSIPHLDEGMPRAIITNFGGLLVKKADGTTDVAASRERCAPLVEAGFDVQTEFYLEGLQPGASPAGLEFMARTQCGFTSRVAPVFSLAVHGLDAYSQWQDTWGWGIWSAEYL